MTEAIVPDWPAPGNIRAFATTRHGPGISELPFYRFNLGARCGDQPAAVQANRAALRREYGLPGEPLWLHQVHGVDVIRFESPHPDPLPHGEGSVQRRGAASGAQADQEPLADAAVTALPGSVLAVLTADCLPVLFCNEAGTEIAAAHAGWRGLAAGVLEQTVAAMHSPPETLMAWLGPAAGPGRYEVGEEVRQAFLTADAAADAAFVPTRPGHHLVDLYALARQRLRQAGVSRCFGGGLCTLSDIRFYSHRREQRTGRMATLIWRS